MRLLVVFTFLTLTLGAASAPARSVAELEKTLWDWRLGCGDCVVRLEWDARALARFVAGRLAGLGFSTLLARSGETWWVLVRCSGADGEPLIPVLPGLPPQGWEGKFSPGVFLGRIPWTAPGVPDPRYTSPEEVLPLPPNAPPTVRIRVHPPLPQVGEEVWFILTATDPDGAVVLVQWDFGDGETSTVPSPNHTYTQAGRYKATVTVVDDGGCASTATVELEVDTPLPPPPGGGCGCGR